MRGFYQRSLLPLPSSRPSPIARVKASVVSRQLRHEERHALPQYGGFSFGERKQRRYREQEQNFLDSGGSLRTANVAVVSSCC